MSSPSPTPRVRRAISPDDGQKRFEPGICEAFWEDGVSCVIVRVLGGWGVVEPQRDISPGARIPYHSSEALPTAAHVRTRREILEILTEWRRRDLASAAAQDARGSHRV